MREKVRLLRHFSWAQNTTLKQKDWQRGKTSPKIYKMQQPNHTLQRERTNLKNLQTATTIIWLPKTHQKNAQRSAKRNKKPMNPKKGQKKVHANAKCNKSCSNPKEEKPSSQTWQKNATNHATQRVRKTSLHKSEKMQHYDHATNQPHNPATKCNNKLMQPKGRKRTYPHKSAKCNIILQQIMQPKRKPNTQNHAIQRVENKSSWILEQQTMQNPKEKKNKTQPHKTCKLPKG